MVGAGELSSRGAKDLLLVLSTDGRGARIIAEEKGLLQKDDPEELKRLAQSVIDKNPESVLSYKSGKSNAIMSLVGGVMKESGGSANPAKAKAMLEELLK